MKHIGVWILGLLSLGVYGQEALKDINQASFLEEGKTLLVNTLVWENQRMIVQYRSPRASSLDVKLVSYKSYSNSKPAQEREITSLCDGDICRFDIDMGDLSSDLVNVIQFTDVNTSESWFKEVRPGENPVPLIITNAFDDILLDRSFLKDTEVYVKSLGGISTIHVYHYTEDFDPADPPTGVRSLPSKELSPARYFELSSGDQLSLNQTGLYFLQTDPRSNVGYSFRVENPPFPAYNSLDDLKKCMIYISTASEWKTLGDEISKSDFDKIWLEAGGNQNNARMAIKNYYGNIKIANLLFTTYKEGWKTDKGMIYTIFGKPDKVTREYGVETWEYDFEYRNKNLTFDFEDRVNIFSPYHSTLERKREYSGPWNYTIENLRKGIKF